MENSVVTTHGIKIEKLSIGWIQLLTAAFLLGGSAYTLANVYTEVVTVKANQEAFTTKYAPIIIENQLKSKEYAGGISALNTTLTRLNDNLTTITALRTKEDEERRSVTQRLQELDNKISNLQVEITKLQK